MTDIELLDQMVKDEAKVAYEKNGNIYVKLTEQKCLDSSVTIFGIPEDAIIIKADSFNAPDSIFKGTKGECRRADFIIVAKAGRKKIVVCIEMKRKSGQENEIIQQLKGARCLLSYCQEIGKAFWCKKDFLDGYIYRFVSIKHISMPKQTTRTMKTDKQDGKIHDQPERMLKISYPKKELRFNMLVWKNQ